MPRGPAGPATRRYLLAGLLACGRCGQREDQVLPHLTAVAILLGSDQAPSNGTITSPDEAAALTDQLWTAGITLTYDPDTGPSALATAAPQRSL